MSSSIPKSGMIGMPMIGFGTWQIPNESAETLVAAAIKAGYNHIDCAHIYGNEAEIGNAFSKVPNRKDLYVVSKLWSTDHFPHRVSPACQTTLENLKLDYLDVYLIHIPFRFSEQNEPLYCKKEWVMETWREMVKLKESGKAKHIGVSNFTTTKLQWLLEEGEKPENNQVELHPYLPQNKLVRFCKDNRIEITAYSPLGSPNTKMEQAGITLPTIPKIIEDPVIDSIAKSHKATPAQVLLKWGMLRGSPVLVKSSSESRMKENLESLNLQLTEQDMNSIANINTKYRYVQAKGLVPPGPFESKIWDDEYFN
ncbi:Aldo-keto reductase family 1 member C1 [Thelohanellus kitauei]|uniref:Aldo-keto reductase family 1 member C1 n=3 Tax=Thelohanellus kitauei TaxID=669202 RepID=A0A0C2N7I9_THEKT|nr:Aldo-keto reductase family 1 member C1 [Thelohanellus kitauei]